MKAVALSLKGLRRDLRAADVRALFVALALAVAASTMIGFFLDRLDRGLTRQAGQLMGGDLVLEQDEPFSTALRESLREAGLTLSQQVDLVSMVSHAEAFQLASLKVVDDAYPLYGQVRVDRGEGIAAQAITASIRTCGCSSAMRWASRSSGLSSRSCQRPTTLAA